MTKTSSTERGLGRVLVVGGGSMGRAICAGLLKAGACEPAALTVANPGAKKRAALEQELDVRTVTSAVEGLPAETIVLAVKPGIVVGVARQLAAAGIRGALVVSIAAGVSTAALTEALGEHVQVVRVMPNTPLIVGRGMSAVSPAAQTSPEACELVRRMFACMGRAVVVEEAQQDIVTALSGSGPAYYELVAESLARSAESLGMDYGTARELAVQTMLGTAALVDETGQDLGEAIEAVSSPGGTTVAALSAMRAGGLVESLDAGIRVASARSAELGS